MPNQSKLAAANNAELVFGLVYGVGADADAVCPRRTFLRGSPANGFWRTLGLRDKQFL